MAFYAYMVRCSDGSFYAGHTDNLEARLYGHQTGILKCYTTSRRPVDLVWCEMFETRDEAFAAERRIKGWSRAKKDALIAGDWVELVRISNLRTGIRRSSRGPVAVEAVAHPSSASG